jgi:hypothetical protein
MAGGDLFEQVFGIGFKVGFLIAFVGVMLFYLPFVEQSVELTLEYMDFWVRFRELPGEMQVIVAGLMLMGAAIIVGAGKELVENMVNTLFGREMEDF